MFLVSQDRLKALDMSDIRGYFIYRGGKFDRSGEPNNFGYTLMANTSWAHYECNQWIIGEYETLDAATTAMQAITAIQNVDDEGRVFVERDRIRFA